MPYILPSAVLNAALLGISYTAGTLVEAIWALWIREFWPLEALRNLRLLGLPCWFETPAIRATLRDFSASSCASQFGLNRTDYGKVVLAARFVNDLATVLALGFKFSPFTFRTLVFAGGSGATFVVMPWLVPRFFSRYGGRPSELEAKLLLLVMFGPGGARPLGR